MNPSESILYPPSYYSDMAFFVAKSIANIFDENSMSRLSSDIPPLAYQKSDIPVIAAAIDGHFSSDWESQLYHFILAAFRKSKLDESVPIGTVVLLDLLGDLYKMGQFTDGRRSRLVLPPYPHELYRCYFTGAFMLAHKLLNREGHHDEEFWDEVFGEGRAIALGGTPSRLENDFFKLLEDNINYYPPPQISSDDPAYQFRCADDVLIRPNPFIARLRYLKMTAMMYAHIRVLMTSRGEPVLKIPAHLPPCHEYMVDKQVFFANTRQAFPGLEYASDEDVHAFLEARSKATIPKDVVGLGLVAV